VSDTFDDIWRWLNDRLGNTGSGLADFAFNLVWAIVVIAASIWLVRRLRFRVLRALEKRHVKNNVPELIANIMTIVAFVIVGSIVLRSLGASSGSLVTSVGLVTAAVSLSLQDVLKNFVAGLYLLAEQPFLPGDRIRVVGEEGRVEKIDIRTTLLRNDRAEQVLIPNFKVFTEVVGNKTAYRLLQLTVLVAGIASDIEDAERHALDCVKNIPGIDAALTTINVIRAAPDAVDLQIHLFCTADLMFRRSAVIALHEKFPDATVTVI
jgi:small-conductance mechanosensitive channel